MRIFCDIEGDGSVGASVDLAGTRERIRANLSGVGATLALASVHGGVGKSMLAVNVAGTLALKGRKVAIADLDLNSPSVAPMLGMKPQRRSPMVEGIEPATGPHGLRVVSSDQLPGGEAPPISFAQDLDEIDGSGDGVRAGPAAAGPVELSYREALGLLLERAQFGSVDWLIIDLAAGIDRLYSVARLVRLDGVLLVSLASAQDAARAGEAMEISGALGAPIVGIVENMVGFNCDGCRAVRPLWPQGGLHGVAREAGVPILARLAFEPRLADSSDRGVLFVREHASTPTGKALVDIANQVEAIVSGRARTAATSA